MTNVIIKHVIRCVAPGASDLQSWAGPESPKDFSQWPFNYLGFALVLVFVTGCVFAGQGGKGAVHGAKPDATTGREPEPIATTPALDLRAFSDLEGIVPELQDKRVVFVGEQHTRYEHHLTQLEIIRRVHANHPRLAIGLEAFQQPFQEAIDDYVAGRFDETELLRNTEYHARWRLDYRLYAPILRYAREHKLPVIALNLPSEITSKVGRGGIEGLSEQERAQIPGNIDRSDNDYKQRIKDVFDHHPRQDGQSFEHFLEVQLLWDEGMAARAAEFLETHPGYRLVVLAGGGHLAYGSGIPNRLVRRLPVDTAIVLNAWQGDIEAGLADFLLLPQERELPPAGKLGALLNIDEDVVEISECQEESACRSAGMKPGDRIVSIDQADIAGMADVRLALWDKKPGDKVTVQIQRKRWLTGPETLSFEVELRQGR